MNREILFRGKRKDNGDWVEGYYAKIGVRHVIIIKQPEDFFTSDMEIGHGNQIIEVISETVGQYTGLTDKNGTKIFEGDIVVDDDGNKGVIKYSIYECGLFIDFWGTEENIYRNKKDMEVIGNIHDYPKLLEGE